MGEAEVAGDGPAGAAASGGQQGSGDDLRLVDRRGSAGAWALLEAGQSGALPAMAPAPDGLPRDAEATGDVGVTQSFLGEQDDVGAGRTGAAAAGPTAQHGEGFGCEACFGNRFRHRCPPGRVRLAGTAMCGFGTVAG